MLSQENRLKKKKEFEAVFKGGRIVRGNSFFLKFLDNGTNRTKIGFVVSKKVSKKAVERNKVKRRLREATREKKDDIDKGLSIVIVALPVIKDLSFEEIKKETDVLFKKGGLIK
ncbi:MAG: ribonuclease P protein component [Candidatus Pacebacteria bacterium]|nr:ribonuclease P protein component [Candidatus Paceibacterota bacterium]